MPVIVKPDDAEAQLADILTDWHSDPAGFSDACWFHTWQGVEREGSKGLRTFQRDVLDIIKRHLMDKATRYQPCRIAISSGHGIGKTALIPMVLDWAMSTMVGTRAQITAGKAEQLKTKVWPEVRKWFDSAINAEWWDVGATSIKFAKDDKLGEIWRCDWMTWSEETAQNVAGLHNEGKRLVVIFDEASTIPDSIWETVEGAFTDANTEIIWMVFSQPTKNTGRFAECFGRYKHRWHTYQIDSRNVEGTNKQYFEEMVADNGEDSDYVRVRVRGEFPRAAWNQFISSEDVEKCRKYKAQGYEGLPKMLVCDVARFGDDQTVIGNRQGRKLRILEKLRGLSADQVAAHIIQQDKLEGPHEVWIIDGDGIGAGVVDHLKFLGYRDRIFEFHGGEAAQDFNKYFNRRAEVWGLLRDDLHAGMEIPDEPELAKDLTGPEYGFSNKQQIQLERKQDMKARGLASPDLGDMAAMSCAVRMGFRPVKHETKYVCPRQSDTEWLYA